MSLIHSLLATAYTPLRYGNNLMRSIGVKSYSRLRVLVYHEIVPHEQELFAAQLSWLAKTWTFVAPQEFAAMMRGDEPIKGANLLLTFDDGFTSNRRVAEEVLNPMGIHALFFVFPTFLDLVNGDDYRSFIASHIWPELPPESVSDHLRNMTWNDLVWLLENGHTIGAHTGTHANLSKLRQTRELEIEIIDSADRLERKLGVKIDHFAYPFGNLVSFSPAALSVARRRFSFIYSTLRGDNACNASPLALRRDGIFPTSSLRLIGSLLEGGADIRYARDIDLYESWVK